MEYEMSKQLFDACASSGTECNSEWKKGCREQPADFSKLTNHNCKTCDPPPATTSLSAGAFFLRFVCRSVFHALKILKLDQLQIYDRREQERDFFFFFPKELVRLRLLLRPVHVWVAPNRKTTCVFLKKTDSSILILIFTQKLEPIPARSVETTVITESWNTQKLHRSIGKMKSGTVIRNRPFICSQAASLSIYPFCSPGSLRRQQAAVQHRLPPHGQAKRRGQF